VTGGKEAREAVPYPGLLAALMAAIRPEFRGEVIPVDPSDPVFGGPPCYSEEYGGYPIGIKIVCVDQIKVEAVCPDAA